MSLNEEIQSLLDQGLVKYGLGEVESALACWKKVLQIDPHNPKAIEYLKFVEESRRTPGTEKESIYRPDETTDPNSTTIQQLHEHDQSPANTCGPMDEIFDPKPSQIEEGVWGDLYGHVASSDEACVPADPPVEIPLDPTIVGPQSTKRESDPKPFQTTNDPSTLPPLPGQAAGPELDWNAEESTEIRLENQSQEITVEFPNQDTTQEAPLSEDEPLEIEISIDEQLLESNAPTTQAKDPVPMPQLTESSQPVLDNKPKQKLPTQANPERPLPKISPQPPFARNDSTKQPKEKTSFSELKTQPAATSSFSEMKTQPEATGSISDSKTQPAATSSFSEMKTQPEATGSLGEDMETDSALDMVSIAEDNQKTVEVEAPEQDNLLQGARDLLALDDFTGALELLDKIDESSPAHAEAKNMSDRAQGQLLEIFSSKLGNLSQIPEVCMNQDEIIWLNLDHKAGFVLSLIDGLTSFENILVLSGLPELAGMRILVNLLQEKVIRSSH